MRRLLKSRWLWSLLALLCAGAAVYRLSRSRGYQLFGEIVARVEVAEPLVALTLDDGPAPGITEEVLAILRERGVRATFFLIGAEVARHPEQARRIIQAGHEVGNHSYSHQRMLFQGRGWMREEITRTDAALRAAGWEAVPLFRPPYGKKLVNLPWVLRELKRTTVTWDVEPDSEPALEGSPAALAAYVVGRARPGSIVLLHAMGASRPGPRRALGPVIDGLRGRGFAFVTASELLARRGS